MPELPYNRPAWLVPVQYNDAPPIPPPSPARDEDDASIDYSRGPNRAEVFGDDSYDTPEPESEELDS